MMRSSSYVVMKPQAVEKMNSKGGQIYEHWYERTERARDVSKIAAGVGEPWHDHMNPVPGWGPAYSPGNLARKIQMEKRVRGTGTKKLTFTVRSRAHYSLAVNNGTSDIYAAYSSTTRGMWTPTVTFPKRHYTDIVRGQKAKRFLEKGMAASGWGGTIDEAIARLGLVKSEVPKANRRRTRPTSGNRTGFAYPRY
jgi:hypothetical protein